MMRLSGYKCLFFSESGANVIILFFEDLSEYILSDLLRPEFYLRGSA